MLSGARRSAAGSVDVRFEYNDRAVHDDIWSVVKFSSGEMMSSELADKVMGFWQARERPTFLRPAPRVRRQASAQSLLCA